MIAETRAVQTDLAARVAFTEPGGTVHDTRWHLAAAINGMSADDGVRAEKVAADFEAATLGGFVEVG